MIKDYARIGYLAHEINRLMNNIRENAGLYSARIAIDGVARVENNLQRDSANSINICRVQKAQLQAMQAEIVGVLGQAEYDEWLAEVDAIEASLQPFVTQTIRDQSEADAAKDSLLGSMRDHAAIPEIYPLNVAIEDMPGSMRVPDRIP